MSHHLLRLFAWLLLPVFSGGCVAHRRPDSWDYAQRQPDAERATESTLRLEVRKKVLPVPLPFILWELGSRRYQIGLEFTADRVAYQQFDSIRYQIRTPGNQLLAAGTLPLRRGRVGRLPWQPWEPLVLERYRIRCATPARLRLGQPRQDLTGSFLVYAVGRAGRPTTLALDRVPLRYNKKHIVTLW